MAGTGTMYSTHNINIHRFYHLPTLNMHIQPAIWSFYLQEYLPPEMARCFAAHGWRTLELGEEHAHDLLKTAPTPARAGTAFRQYAMDAGISFPQGHFIMDTQGWRPEDQPGRRKFDLASADDREFDAAFETMKRWIDLFNALDVRAGVLHAGGFDLAAAGWDAARIFDRRVTAIARIAEYAQGGPTLICLENMGAAQYNMHTAADLLALIRAVNSGHVKICLDTGHANLAGVDIPEFIRAAGAHLRALHIADNLGQTDNHMLPYGAGRVPWPAVLQALGEAGYAGLFNFEVSGETKNCPLPARLAKLDYALTLARDMIEKIAQNMGL